MTCTPRYLATWLYLALAPALLCDETPQPGAWKVVPTVFVLGSYESDESWDGPDADRGLGFGPALAGGLDLGRSGEAGAFEANVSVLTRSPFESRSRRLTADTRLHGFLGSASGWRVEFDEALRIDRQPAAWAPNATRNAFQARLERALTTAVTTRLKVDDRRGWAGSRASLDTRRTGLALGALFRPRAGLALEGAGLLHHADSPAGGSWHAGAAFELAKVGSQGALALAYTWTARVEGTPSGAAAQLAPATPIPTPPDRLIVFAGAPINRTQPQAPALADAPALTPPTPGASFDAPLAALIDPLEPGDDGRPARQEHTLTFGATRAFGARTRLSLRGQWQFRRELLLPEPVSDAVDEQTLHVRAAIQVRLATHVALLAQASRLNLNRNPGERFARTLVFLGLQLH